MRAGDEIEVTVEAVDDDATGEAFVGGTTLKIPGAAPGDRLLIRAEHISPHRPVAWCRTIRVLSRGAHFVSPPCIFAEASGGRCGGCPAVHLDDETYCRMKTDHVEKALAAVGLSPAVFFFPAADRFGYRNRGHFVAARDKNGRAFLGAYAQRSREIVPISDCLVLMPKIRKTARLVTDALFDMRIPIFPEPFGLRYLTLRSTAEGETLADFVVTGERPFWAEKLADFLMSNTSVVGVSYSVNNSSGNALRTSPSLPLAGKQFAVEKIGERSFYLGAASFSQLCSDTAGKMYRRAAAMVSGASVLWDLYCGAGGLGLTMLSSCAEDARLFGAECVASAVALARKNASAFAERAFFETADLSSEVSFSWPAPDAVSVNPPRKGLDNAVLTLLKNTPARTVVYMSCNPKSFAADVAALVAAGFAVKEVFAYDMLPCTAHVEIIAKLERTESL
jgi:23S rRNA (uracil1939-C5)-methyltransferase